MSSSDSVILEKVRYTSRGGALCVYKTTIDGPMAGQGKRGEVTELSINSRNRLAFVASNADCRWASMITLTYGAQYPDNGRDSKRDLNAFLTALRRTVGKGLKYLWFLEFQARGAPHYHILLSVEYNADIAVKLINAWVDIVSGYVEQDADKENIEKFNRHKGGTDFWQNARSLSGLSHYAVKYATKTQQKSVPPQYANVGRFWGCSRNLVEYVGEEYIGGQQYTELLIDVLVRKGLRGAPKFIFGD